MPEHRGGRQAGYVQAGYVQPAGVASGWCSGWGRVAGVTAAATVRRRFGVQIAHQGIRRHGQQIPFSDVKRKNSETIAYLHDQDRQAMQKFIGQSPWKDRPLIGELAQQIGRELGEPDGVLVFDPSAFKKQGRDSVGVARQWCGRLGKIDNCQVGVYLGYVSRKEHALVDMRLYLNRVWAKDSRFPA